MSVDQFLLSADTTDLNYPDVRPTLDLNFARTKVLDPRITFTRASGGSYVGADGLIKYAGVNEPRFDHDLATGESLGLLIEESRTNLFLRSDIEGTVGSTPTNAVVPYTAQGQSVVVSTDVFLGPNGQSAKHTKGSQGDTNIGYYGASGLTIGQIYCASIWLYIPSSQANNFAGKFISFQPESTPSATNVSAASYNTNLVDVWQRAFCVFTAGSTNTSIIPRTNASAGSFFYTDAWQLELGSFPTSYIPTQASTRTRALDSAIIEGNNFNNFYNPSEGTFFSDVTFQRNNVAAYIWQLGFNQNRMLSTGRVNGESWTLLAINNNIFTDILPSTYNAGKNKWTSSYKDRDFAGVQNNGTILKSTVNKVPTLDGNTLRFGSFNSIGNFLNGTISRITYWPKRLPDAQLQALTR